MDESHDGGHGLPHAVRDRCLGQNTPPLRARRLAPVGLGGRQFLVYLGGVAEMFGIPLVNVSRCAS